MRILFLSHYFPPEVNAPATRTFEHCREWAANGHEVTVVSCVPNHPMGKLYPGYRNRFVQIEMRDNIRVVRVLTYATANQGFLRRSLNYVLYMVMAMLVAPFLPRADVVVSTSPQFFNGLAGYFVGKIKRCPWVLEIRDLWPASIVAVGALQNPTIIRALEALERFAYRKADLIVPVTRPFAAHIERMSGRTEGVTVVPNGVDFGLFSLQGADDDCAKRVGIAGKFVAAYVGTHGMAHGLDTLLDAAEQLRKRPDIVFLLAGDGAERQRLEDEIRMRKLPNVIMLGQLPKEEMPRLWACSHASLVPLRRLELFTTVIPSKIFESMAMKKPLILGVEGEAARIVNEAGAGICIEPENPDQLAAAVARLADDPDLAAQLGDAGYAYVRAHYDRRGLAVQFESLLRALVPVAEEVHAHG